MSDNTTSKMIILKSSDGVVFEVPETVAKQSQTLRDMIENGVTMTITPLPNVNALTLAKVIEYCTKHVDAADESKPEMNCEGSSKTPASSRMSVKELRNWEKQFVDVDPVMLNDLTMAADYLDIEGLRDVLYSKTS